MRAQVLALLVLVHQAMFAATTVAAAVPRLFVPLPDNDVAAASAPELPKDVQVVFTSSAGRQTAPNIMTTMINHELLLQAEPVQIDLPGLSRGIRVKWQSTAAANSRMAAAPATATRVGEVQGLPGGLSFVGMVSVGDSSTVYGDIRFLDRSTRTIRSYRVMPAGSTATGNTTYTVVEYKEPNGTRHFAVPQYTADNAAAAAPALEADPASAVTVEAAPAATAAPATSDEVPAALVTGDGQRRRLQQAAPIVQELLVAYTPAAAQAAGGDAAIRSQAELTVMRTNKAYTDSGVNVQLVLLDVRRFDFNERQFKGANEVFSALGRQGTATRMHPTLSQWRNEVGADLVSVFTASMNDNICGVGFWPTNWNQDNSEAGLSTVNGCWAGYTLAHEIGHNQGCGHNWDDSAADGGGRGYFYGWRRCDQGRSNFKTILSYWCPAGTTTNELGAFSTPSRRASINGRTLVIGDATRGNCARAISESAARVAAYRATRPPTGGGSGGNYTCTPRQDARGTDIQLLSGVTEDACRAACNSNAACTFYVYMRSRACWLKKDYNNGPNGATGPNANVANLCQKSGSPPTAPTYSCVTGQDARGTDIRGFGVASEADCRMACTNEPMCSFYVLVKPSAAWNNQFPCFLKRDKNNGPHGATGPNANVVSLCDKSGGSPGGGYSCLPAQNVRGTDIRSFVPFNEQGCRSACSADTSCTFYVYVKPPSATLGTCWLKKDYNNGPHGVTGPDANVVNACQKTG